MLPTLSSQVSGARITVWYEEEHGGRKMDVPYVGVVNSCDPREGLYVKFEVSVYGPTLTA